ncbi:MAG: HNH endonuclease, partial [Chloroflexales bacterium]
KHLRTIKAYLDTHQQVPAGQVVHDLNPVIRGWTNYYCGMCWVPFGTDDPIEADHIVPRHAGGSDEPENKRPVHSWCHHQHHQRQGYKVLKA